MAIRGAFSFLLFLMSAVSTAAPAPESVYYGRRVDFTDHRDIYALKLLGAALGRSASSYKLLPSQQAMTQRRALKELEDGSPLVQVVWCMTTKAREQQAFPIRIPIDKGLLGWRLALLTKQNSDAFKSVRSIKDLSGFTAVQGHDWPDIDILRSNGLSVYGGTSYEGLFNMLAIGHADYFPRSVAEIGLESYQYADKNVVVDAHIALHYPNAFYYFVNKNNKKLAGAITQGLEAMIADGSYERMFHQYFDGYIKNAHFERRIIIELNNPLLPVSIPVGRKELWVKLP